MNDSGCIVGHELLLQLDFSQLIRHSHKVYKYVPVGSFSMVYGPLFRVLLVSEENFSMSDKTLAKMSLFTTRNKHGWS